MWEPKRLTTLWASTACYTGSFPFFTFMKMEGDDRYLVRETMSEFVWNHFQGISFKGFKAAIAKIAWFSGLWHYVALDKGCMKFPYSGFLP
jgi:hypothetical protein